MTTTGDSTSPGDQRNYWRTKRRQTVADTEIFLGEGNSGGEDLLVKPQFFVQVDPVLRNFGATSHWLAHLIFPLVPKGGAEFAGPENNGPGILTVANNDNNNSANFCAVFVYLCLCCS